MSQKILLFILLRLFFLNITLGIDFDVHRRATFTNPASVGLEQKELILAVTC